MANVLNKHTLKYLKSVNTPDYNNDDWIINPTIPNCSNKYWKIVGNNVVEMSKSEKETKDDQITADNAVSMLEHEAYYSNIDNIDKMTQAIALVLLDEINKLNTKVNLTQITKAQLKSMVKNKYETIE